MRQSLIRLLDMWDSVLDEETAVDADLAGTLDIKLVRDLIMAAASTDAGGAMARAIAGAELLGMAPKGAGALAGHLPHQSDGDWLAAIILGEDVTLPGRVRPLHDAMQAVIDGGLNTGTARAHALVIRGWSSWLLGRVAEARADLSMAADQGPGVDIAGQLLQFIDMQQGR
jgi:hypothetical protein